MLGKFFSFAVAAGAGLAAPRLLWACAVCLTGTDGPIADGYNASVLFLMAAPYVVMASIAGVMITAYRRAIKRRAETEARESGIQLAWSQEESGR